MITLRSGRRQVSREGRFGSRAAFTLVELLVVMAIVSILASMLLPVLAKSRLAAWQIDCAGKLRQFGIANVQYGDDWGGASCGSMQAVAMTYYSPGDVLGSEWAWAKKLSPSYLPIGKEHMNQWTCREYFKARGFSKWGGYVVSDQWWSQAIAYCYGLYGSSCKLGSPAGSGGYNYFGDYDYVTFKPGRIRAPSRVVMFNDAGCIVWYERNIATCRNEGYRFIAEYDRSAPTTDTGPHLGRGNYVMYDGHLETLSSGTAYQKKITEIRQ